MLNPLTQQKTNLPTGPVSFGFKMAWIAIRCDQSEEVVNFLLLESRRNLSWEKGIEAAYDSQNRNEVFVTPSINGWTFVVGWYLEEIEDAQPKHRVYKLLEVISSKFGEAQAFATHRVVETHVWMLAKEGNVLRTFACSGENDKSFDFGPLTEVEQALEFFEQPKDQWFASEDDVMLVAAGWSIDPASLTEESGKAELGVFGEIGLKVD